MPDKPRTRKPQFVDLGPACLHDIPCPVYWDASYSAVYEMTDCVFLPSWEAQRDGYVLLRVKSNRLRRILKRLFPARSHGGWPIGERKPMVGGNAGLGNNMEEVGDAKP